MSSTGWWWWWWWPTQRNLVGSRGDVGRRLLCWLHSKLIQVLHGGSDGLEQASGHGGTIGNGFVGLAGAVLGEGLWVTHSGWTVLHIDIGMGLRVRVRLRLGVAAGEGGELRWWWSVVGSGCKLWWRWWRRQCSTGTAAQRVILLGMH